MNLQIDLVFLFAVSCGLNEGPRHVPIRIWVELEDVSIVANGQVV